MHISNVTILLAVAARLVGDAAHAESDIVTTDGPDEVQRKLRVQEREHDEEDDDERITREVENIINLNVPEYAAEILKPETNALKRPAEMLESEGRPAKNIRFDLVANVNEAKGVKEAEEDMGKHIPLDDFLADLWSFWLKNMENSNEANLNPENAFSTILSHYEEGDWRMLFEKANEDFLNTQSDPQEVFQLYGLHLAGDKLFEQPQLVYWVKYMDAFNDASPTAPKNALLSRLLKSYSMDILLNAAVKAPNDEIALRVQDEIRGLWLVDGFAPDDAFTWLRLDKAGVSLFDSRLFLFWMNYVTNYNSMAHHKVSMLSVLKTYLDKELLRTLLRKIPKSGVTQHLENEMEVILLEKWADTRFSVEKVHEELRAMETAADKESVYGKAVNKESVFESALRTSAAVYIDQHQ